MRDILAMGARPVVVLDSLRFGPPEAPDTRRVLPGVVSGISFYGNCLGPRRTTHRTTTPNVEPFQHAATGVRMVCDLSVTGRWEAVPRQSDRTLTDAPSPGGPGSGAQAPAAGHGTARGPP